MILPLPSRVSALIDQARTGYHPGLALDKHADPPTDAEKQKPSLEKVCSGARDQSLLDKLAERRRSALRGSIRWAGKSSSPLTLHLSRATAFENAGIALHPIYGFAHLPGSGLKGLARAWAERVWLEAQSDREQAVRHTREVFGYAPNSERSKPWIPEEIARDALSSAGAVIFHDAWPRRWPKLFVDVVAVHHPKYYQADEKDVPPSGDWEDPVPTTFLAVDAGSEFEFAVVPRRPKHADLARQAAEWLKAALADWGVGAKTAAGYGRIVSENLPTRVCSPLRCRFECTLELVTPAFLAGAFQKAEDCDLRGATLRGQLRWWWRTMHAGHLEPRLLRRLETAIWGAAGEGGAVQLSLAPANHRRPGPFQHREALGYIAYGMREAGRPTKPAGSSWRLVLSAREGEFRIDPKSKERGQKIEAAEVLRQAQGALWLLTHYGGVGGKGRKGFGSLADVTDEDINTVDDCERLAANLRGKLALRRSQPDFRAPCLEKMWLAREPIPLREIDPQRALAAVAAAYRSFVNPPRGQGQGLPFESRRPLGLPRKNKVGELNIDFGSGVGHTKRHPTTVHLHLARSGGNALVLRLAGFAIERIDDARPAFFERLTAACAASSAGDARGDSRPRSTPRSGGAGPVQPSPAGSLGFQFRRGDQVHNAAGDIGTVLEDVRVGETEMMVDIDGDHEREQVRNWQKVLR